MKKYGILAVLMAFSGLALAQELRLTNVADATTMSSTVSSTDDDSSSTSSSD